MRLSLALILCAFLYSACGRYGAPLAPELYSPTEVKDLTVAPDALGVRFEWTAPKKDQRGKELQQIDGYLVYRKQINNFARLLDDKGKFEKLTLVKDQHIVERDKLRAEARALGKVARTIEVEPDKLKFSFSDSTVQPGLSYVYKIVPVSQGDVEGLVKSYVKLRFLGVASTVIIDESPEGAPALDSFYLKY